MIVFEQTVFDGHQRRRVHRLCAKRLFWNFTMRNQDQFEEFIRQIADAWERAEQDKMGLRVEVHQDEDL